jgi:hypothetical protein
MRCTKFRIGVFWSEWDSAVLSGALDGCWVAYTIVRLVFLFSKVLGVMLSRSGAATLSPVTLGRSFFHRVERRTNDKLQMLPSLSMYVRVPGMYRSQDSDVPSRSKSPPNLLPFLLQLRIIARATPPPPDPNNHGPRKQTNKQKNVENKYRTEETDQHSIPSASRHSNRNSNPGDIGEVTNISTPSCRIDTHKDSLDIP